mgnify:CR=1 FL=1
MPPVPGVLPQPGAPLITSTSPFLGYRPAKAAISGSTHTLGGLTLPLVRSKVPPGPLWLAAAAVEPSEPMLWQTVQLPRSTSGTAEVPLMRSIAPFCWASGEL